MDGDLNKVVIIGRLAADPEMRFTDQGTAVTRFPVVTSRQWRDASGAIHDDTEWFQVIAWNKLAEICNEYLSAGRLVYVEGQLQTRSRFNTGGERYMIGVAAEDVIFLDPPSAQSAARDEPRVAGEAAPSPPSTATPPAVAFGKGAASGKPSASGTSAAAPPAVPRRNVPTPVEDDDLPF